MGTVVRWSNWAGNQRAEATQVAAPGSAAELAGLIRRAAEQGVPVKAVGSGHSFTAAASTDGLRIELTAMAGLISVDAANRLVTVGAGIRLHDLNHILDRLGLALPNLGDVDTQTISGALATGTHGTGARLGALPTFVHALTLVTGTGEVVRCSTGQRADLFSAALVGIGAVGVVTEVTLRCVDAFLLRADERPDTLRNFFAAQDELLQANDHLEMYWFPHTDLVQTKCNNKVEQHSAPLGQLSAWLTDDFLSNTVFGLTCRLGRRVPALAPRISSIAARALSARVYTAPSHQVFCTPRRVRFVEMEYALPRTALREAFTALRSIVDNLPTKVLFPVEVRFTAADNIWLSHGYQRDSAYIAIHQYVGAPYEPYFRAFERVATELTGRPHWGKLHWRTAEQLRSSYPKFDAFQAVRDEVDPQRVFRNAYTRQVLGD